MRRYKSCAVFFFFLLFMLIIQERKGGLFIYARRPDYWLVAALNEGISGATGVLLTGVLVFSWGFYCFFHGCLSVGHTHSSGVLET